MSEVTAYHEAGHAFVALFVGAEVTSMTVDPDWDDGPERYGDTQIRWPAGRFTDREYCEKAVLVALAGPVAEMIHTGDPFHPGLVGEWAGDWADAVRMAEPLIADERKRIAFLEQQTLWLYRLMDREDHWAALCAIVDHLLAHETLEGEMIAEVMSDWMQ
ncbi:ATP-dependent zinc metalloprotease FtsH [Maioricimonas rarisocia]|uniref:ATP-dependent zinc metalloprotease FtsH n=1 Tax=Maioricimonas rarisocia TaxID=2528026 RepID=A0A517Z4C0_9PLAN|nr:hypothetical protein [Maioricimonas rarisocia]QDU37332.1 ATP-dependent zinc metalloprotease FtsH [Maioricimonas rarisocia]